jgi:glycosyltransferase involved in cell wall biosynthesis
MTTSVRVSTIIPAYNSARTIREAIDSALAQDFDGQEIIVVDDGSTDSTSAILESYGGRIKVITQPNSGPAVARNAGAQAGTGEYLAFLDSDDLWLPHKLAESVKALSANQFAVLAFSDCIALREDGRQETLWRSGRAPCLEEMMKGGWPILPSAVVMRRAAFESCGGFSEEFRYPGGEDPLMWWMARERGEFVYLPEPLAIYRTPPLQLLADKYAAGAPVFVRYVRQRYPAKARMIKRQVYAERSAYLLAKACHQFDSGDHAGAGQSLLLALWASPAHIFRRGVIRRLLRRRNLSRIKTIFSRGVEP